MPPPPYSGGYREKEEGDVFAAGAHLGVTAKESPLTGALDGDVVGWTPFGCSCCSLTKPGSVVRCLAAWLYIETDRGIPTAKGRLVRVILCKSIIPLASPLLCFRLRAFLLSSWARYIYIFLYINANDRPKKPQLGGVCMCVCVFPFWMIRASDLQTDWVIPGTTSQNRSYKGRASEGRAQPVMSSDPPARPRDGGREVGWTRRSSSREQRVLKCAFDRRSVDERRTVREGRGKERGRRRGCSRVTSLSRRPKEISLPLPSPRKGNSQESRSQLAMQKSRVFPSLRISFKDVGGIFFPVLPPPAFPLLLLHLPFCVFPSQFSTSLACPRSHYLSGRTK